MNSALVLPHPAMTAAQCELLCAREGLALAHLGRGRLVLVQTSTPPQSMLRLIGLSYPDGIPMQHSRALAKEILARIRGDDWPDPEAA